MCVDLVMELAAGGSLWSRIKRGSYTEATAAKYGTAICNRVHNNM